MRIQDIEISMILIHSINNCLKYKILNLQIGKNNS